MAKLKMNREQIELAYSALTSEGWDIVLSHIKDVIEAQKDRLVESNDAQDEKIKGYIQGLQREILPLRDMFQEIRREVMDEEEVKRK